MLVLARLVLPSGDTSAKATFLNIQGIRSRIRRTGVRTTAASHRDPSGRVGPTGDAHDQSALTEPVPAGAALVGPDDVHVAEHVVGPVTLDHVESMVARALAVKQVCRQRRHVCRSLSAASRSGEVNTVHYVGPA